MKFLVPNYSCLQNPWLGGLPPPDPRPLCPLSSTEFVEPPHVQNSWVRHWIVGNSDKAIKQIRNLINSNRNEKNAWKFSTETPVTPQATKHAKAGNCPTPKFIAYLNLSKPNDTYICRTAQLTSRRYILNIYSTNIHTEYFKHAAQSPFFSLFKMPFIS